MRRLQMIIISVVIAFWLSCDTKSKEEPAPAAGEMKVRIAELEIEPEFLVEYIAILKDESEASIRLEPGVICIYPMFQKERPNQIRLLEIYASKEAYASHLESPHFKHYKEATLHMVRSLELIDMQAIDPESMPDIFLKLTK